MLRIVDSAGFRRDTKLMRKRGKDMEKLYSIVDLLANIQSLPSRCRPHKLSGDWAGQWELHIEPDWLLIYDISDEALYLSRTGTHSDLFQ